jgi:S-adenosylmethionine:tRNA ribosyltransferase-isomerase
MILAEPEVHTRIANLHPWNRLLDFELPPELEAGEPPEARGLSRDQVQLMVSYYQEDVIFHTRFWYLPEYLSPGDVLVINTSATLKAALPAGRPDGTPIELRLSTQLSSDQWVVELRQARDVGGEPILDARPGEQLRLHDRGKANLLVPYDPSLRENPLNLAPVRLWIASLDLPLPVNEYLELYGHPIRYKYVRGDWPIEYYQTVYANAPGSAEMPSAGRAFTPELITRLVAGGFQVAPLVLHTGVASPEAHERPYEEYYRIPPETAQAVNAARMRGKRVIAVGTTVVRALETTADASGRVAPGEGWTDLVITPERGLHSVDGLLTGFHEPSASHLGILLALAGQEHLAHAYRQALADGYLWHEFGDLHLILPSRV